MDMGLQTLTESVCGVWRVVLGIEAVAPTDRLWALGGTSMQAVEIAYRLQLGLQCPTRPPLPLGSGTVADYVLEVRDHWSDAKAEASSQEQAADPAGEAAPLSTAHAQMLFLDGWGDAWRAYRTHAKLEFDGPLCTQRLAAALDQLLARHELLRSAFVGTNGRERLEASRVAGSAVTLLDLSETPQPQQAQQLDEATTQWLQYRFDLASAPLVRWTLVRLARDRHVLMHVEHHCAGDATSWRTLLTELVTLYNGSGPLPALRATYEDHARAEAAWRRSAAFARDAQAWVQRLQPAIDQPPLFGVSRRRAERSFAGAQVRRPMSLAAAGAMKRGALSLGVSQFVASLAAFAVLCARHSDAARFLLGTAIQNRPEERFAGVVGMFVNMVPLPFDVQPACTFRDFVQACARQVEFALRHSAVPVSEMVRRLGISHVLRGDAPFNVAFSFNDGRRPEPAFGEAAARVEELVDNGSAKFDLNVVVNVDTGHPDASGTELVFEYAAQAFDAVRVQALSAEYEALLESCLARPNVRLSELLPSPAAARSQWGAALPLPPHRIHELFEQQVLRSGEDVAVRFGDRHLGYRDLNAKANQVARRLRGLGVVSGALVGICMERSLETVVAVLAVLKAGAAYVPVDPAYPEERVLYMLEDTAASVVITQGAHRSLLRGCRAELLCLDEDDASVHGLSPENLELPSQPSDLAYCLYTSGSTGKPKGVLVEHGAVVNFLASFAQLTRISAEDVLLSVTPLTFDICGLELYLPLMSGATAIVASRSDARDPARLVNLIRVHGATMLQSTPATWRMLRFHQDAEPWHLRVALCGGEAMDGSLARFLLDTATQAFNVYGPTETTIWSTCAPLADLRLDGERTQVPLGYPIANTQIHLLAEDGTRVAPGQVGEIHIGGAGLARGYLNRAELTRQRFIVSEAGRLYKTGDLGRFNADGELEYLGRIDLQVKLRGFRIELGEIESVLMGHPDVREAAVVVHEDRPGDGRLVAFVGGVTGGGFDEDTLRAHAARVLPEHMRPAQYVFLSSLPLNGSGKVDRKALPAVPAPASRHDTHAGASSPVEARVTRLWEEVLCLPAIGAQDNFFDVGGTSLSLATLRHRLFEEFGTSPTLIELFDLPRVRDQAQYLAERLQPKATATAGFACEGAHPDQSLLQRIVEACGLGEDDRVVVLGDGASAVGVHLALHTGAACVVHEPHDAQGVGRKLAVLEGVDEAVSFATLAQAIAALPAAACVVLAGDFPAHGEVLQAARALSGLKVVEPSAAGPGARLHRMAEGASESAQ